MNNTEPELSFYHNDKLYIEDSFASFFEALAHDSVFKYDGNDVVVSCDPRTYRRAITQDINTIKGTPGNPVHTFGQFTITYTLNPDLRRLSREEEEMIEAQKEDGKCIPLVLKIQGQTFHLSDHEVQDVFNQLRARKTIKTKIKHDEA